MRIGHLLIVMVMACSSKDTPSIDAPPHRDGPDVDTQKVFMDAPPNTTPLTVKNYEEWCSVSVNGGAASTSGSQVVNVAPGAIPLVAEEASATFEVAGNMWHFVDGDPNGTGVTGTVTGSGATTQSAATVTVSTTAKCVWVCCPFSNGTGCTGLANQCP